MEKVFSERLKECRHRKGVSQQQVAEGSDISVRSYICYENMVRVPRLSILYRIAKYFDVSMDYLMGRQDTPQVYGKMEEPESRELDGVTQKKK